MDKKKGQKKDRQRGGRMLKKYRFELELGALCVVFVAWKTHPFLMELIGAVLVAAVPSGLLLLAIFACTSRICVPSNRAVKKGSGKTKNKEPDFSENTGYLKARDWYNNYGRMRIARLIRDLQEEGIQEAWIRPDGICNVNTEKGYRRRAILTDFPSGHMYEIAKWTKAEQIAGARVSGKYIRLSVPERAS